jgi:hypothetical protein
MAGMKINGDAAVSGMEIGGGVLSSPARSTIVA